MARSNKTLTKVGIVIATILFNFLREVHRCNEWKNFFISTAILFALISLFFNISPNDSAMGLILSTPVFIVYCVYWFNNLSVKTVRLNAHLWKQREWWWGLDGWQFEQEVANVFRINGYHAEVTKGSGDGGVDIILTKDGRISIVQCKHYQNPVPPEPIRALWGVKNDFGASEVILVASSGITESGARFVRNKPEFKVLNLDDIIYLSQAEQTYENNVTPTPQTYQYREKVHTQGRKLDL